MRRVTLLVPALLIVPFLATTRADAGPPPGPSVRVQAAAPPYHATVRITDPRA